MDSITGMNVLFGYSSDFSTISSVYWQPDGESVMVKILRRDGSVSDEPVDWPDLKTVCDRVAGSYYPMYPAVVEDLRSAFKYLGKSSDLVETLPEANVGCKTDRES